MRTTEGNVFIRFLAKPVREPHPDLHTMYKADAVRLWAAWHNREMDDIWDELEEPPADERTLL